LTVVNAPRRLSLILIVLACSLLGCSGTDHADLADDPRAFFRGRTLTYIVSTQPGGGYDTYGRLIGKYLRRHLDLQHVVVRNMAGGSHILGANAINAAVPDGLTIGTFNSGLLYSQLLGEPALVADLRRMSWIGKAGNDARVLVLSARSPFRSLDDIRGASRPLLLGTNSVGNESYYDALLLAHGLGLDVKLVFGLGAREAQLSMMRGEIDGELASSSTHRQFIRDGYGVAALRVGTAASLDATVPDAAALVGSDDARRLVAIIGAISQLLRWTAGPPGIPAERLAVLREAYMAALQDPELIAEAQRIDIPIAPMDGATLAAEIQRMLATAAESRALISSILRSQP
jgi:tripartite-type tricarboxylate transporter receptor subunit TctC